MTAQSPEEAYNRLAGLWALAEFQFDHEYLLSDWIAFEYDLASPTSRDIYERFKSTCNLTASLEDFEAFTGFKYRVWPFSPRINQTLTLGELSVWLLNHCDLPDVHPLHIAGQVCEPGGIFLAMSDLVRRTTGDDRIRPSSPVADVLQPDQFQRFLWQVQVASRLPIPAHSDPTALYGCLAFLLMPLGLIVIVMAWAVADDPAIGSLVGLATIAIGFVLCLIRVPDSNWFSTESFLPPKVITFGDLARVFAANEQISIGDAT